MDQLSNNIRVEEDKPPNQTLQRNQFLRLSSYPSKTIFVHMRSQTKRTVWCFPQWSISDSRRIYIRALTPRTTNDLLEKQPYLRIKQIECCYFLIVTVVSSIPECGTIVYRRIIYGKNMLLGKNYHTQQWTKTSSFTSLCKSSLEFSYPTQVKQSGSSLWVTSRVLYEMMKAWKRGWQQA